MFENRETMSSPAYVILFEEVACLRQSEEVSREAVKTLSDIIMGEGVWTTVIPAEMASSWVMDGNHRLNVARYLGLKYLPVVRLSYEDPRVSVLRWDNDKPYPLDQIDHRVKSGLLLPFKTTRHRFDPLLPVVEIPLDVLRTRQEHSCVNYHL